MRKLAQVTTTLVLATVVLSGCGDDARDVDETTGDPTASPSDPVAATDWGKPATGPKVTGTGYTYRVPTIWADVTKRAKTMQARVDTAASEKAATDGFADNLSVDVGSEDVTLDQLATSIPVELEALVKKLEALPRVTIDGVEALHFRGPARSAGTDYFLEQFAAVHDGGVVVINFSLGRSMTAARRDALIASVMASWKWAG